MNINEIPDTGKITKRAYIGIDPGKDGGIVVLYPPNYSDSQISMTTIPLLGDDIDVKQLTIFFEVLLKSTEYEYFVVLENVHSIFGSSAKSNFTFGKVNGVLQTLIEVHKLPFQKVNPKQWQKRAFEGVAQNPEPKVMALVAASRLFPNTSFIPTARSKTPHNGLIDAALMAWYGKVTNL